MEELESSDDDDGAGVHVDIGQRRFAGDELLYAGADLRAISRGEEYDDYLDYDDDGIEVSLENPEGRVLGMQLAMRDKEERLVQTAMARIRRAQMLGKTNVKLSQPELDALERKRMRAAAAAAPQTPKGKKAIKGRPKAAEERPTSRGGRAGPSTPPAGEVRRRRVSNAVIPPYPVGPGEMPGAVPNGVPAGYYAPLPTARPSSSGSRGGGGSRTPSSQSLRQQASPQLPQYGYPNQARYFSYPEVGAQVRPTSSSRNASFTRPLPDDPSWAPRSRSSSTLVPYPDPAQFQAMYPPPAGTSIDPRYGRRNPSAPMEFYHRQPDEIFLGSHSDPTLPASRGGRVAASNPIVISSDEDDEDEDDDGHNGVEVVVEERRGGSGYDYRTLPGGSGGVGSSSGAKASATSSSSGSPKKSGGRRRKARR